MNKCSKCGKEFEGNFCPACAAPSDAPKVCPKCGRTLSVEARFCSKCGYDLYSEVPRGAKRHVSPALRKTLRLLPFVLFAVWALLLWAIYAIPAATKSDGGVNVYALNSHPYADTYFISAHALITLGIISCIYGLIIFAAIQFGGDDLWRMIISAVSLLLPIAVIVCAANLYVDLSEDFLRENYIGYGPVMWVLIGYCALYIVLQIAAIITNRVLGLWDFQMERRLAKSAKRREIDRMTASKIHFLPIAILFTFWAVFAYTELVKLNNFDTNSVPNVVFYLAMLIVIVPCCLVWSKKWKASLVCGALLSIGCYIVLQLQWSDFNPDDYYWSAAAGDGYDKLIVMIMQIVPIVATIILGIEAVIMRRKAVFEYEDAHKPQPIVAPPAETTATTDTEEDTALLPADTETESNEVELAEDETSGEDTAIAPVDVAADTEGEGESDTNDIEMERESSETADEQSEVEPAEDETNEEIKETKEVEEATLLPADTEKEKNDEVSEEDTSEEPADEAAVEETDEK